MKIGIDARLWNQTGVGRYTRNLVKNLLEQDNKNTYVLFIKDQDYQDLKSQLVNWRINLKSLEEKERLKIVKTDIHWHSFEEQIKMPKLLARENLDLMHFPYFSIPVFYRRPYVITMHDLIVDHFSTGKASTLPNWLYFLKRMGYRYVTRQAIKHSKMIFVPTESVKNEIIDHFGTDKRKIIVTSEGVDDEISSSTLNYEEVEKKVGIKNLQDKNYFLYVGNAYPHKNLSTLVSAFELLKSELNSKAENLCLFLVGKEDYFYKRLKDEVKKRNTPNVYFLGFVEDKVLSFLYNKALALVLPSFMEGFGLTAIEAMDKRCLVVVSAIPELKEICGKAAYYFNPNSILELKEDLDKIYHSKEEEREKLKDLGKERVKEFSWKKMTLETLKIYESCISL